MSDLGTAYVSPFHGLLAFEPLRDHLFTCFSPLRYSTCVYCFNRATALRLIARSVRLDTGTGILTCFPFGVLELRHILGPTNPRLTNIVEETWPLRRSGFSPDSSFYYCQNSHFCTVHRTSQPCFHPCTTPPYTIISL